MAIALRSVASAGDDAAGTSLTITKPAGVVSGDFLLAFLSVTNDNDGVTTPTGWTLIRADVTTTATSTNVYSFFRFADGTEGTSFTFTWTTSACGAGGILALTGVDRTSPVNAQGGVFYGNTTTPAAQSVTTTVTDCWLVCLWSAKPAITGNSPQGSMTERWDVVSAGTQPNTSVCATEPLTSAGATGTRTATYGASPLQSAAQTLAITPVQNTPVARALSANWNARGRIAKAQNNIWNVRFVSGAKSLAAVWNTFSIFQVQKNLIGRWNTRSRVTDTSNVQWNTRSRTGTKALGTIWHIRTIGNKSVIVRWNTRAIVSSARAAIWYVGGTTARSSIRAIWITYEPPPPVQIYAPTFISLQDIISKSHRKTARIVVYDSINGRPVYSSDDLLIPGGLISGGVNFGNAAVRRRASLSFIDRTGQLTPGDSTLDIFSIYGHVFKVWRGVMVNGVNHEYPLGAFGITDVSVDDSGPGVQISVDGYDYGDLLSRRGLIQDYSIPKGTNFASAIQSLLSQQMPGIEFNFVTTSYETPALFFQTSENPWEAAIMMAKSIGCDLFFDPNGVCTMRYVPDYSVVPVGFTYDETAINTNTALYVNKRYTNRDSYNYFIVTGEHSGNATTGGGGPIRGDAYDDNPNSRTYWRGTYGTVPAPPVSSKLITSQAQADQAARGLLQNSIGRAERLHFNALVNPMHEVGDVIQFKRVKSKIDNRYVIDSGYIPLGHDQPMDLTTRIRQSVS